ncbi:MAG: AsnC family transcriptional regulator [Promethearchaeia archaeon]
MLAKKFSLDEVDKKIIELVQKNPQMTHTTIAKKVDRSQPTVGLRIRRLKDSGLLQFQAGTNVTKSDDQLAKVEIRTNAPEKFEKIIRNCPFMVHGFRLTGDYNFSIIIIGSSVKELNDVIEIHFRKDPDVDLVRMNLITNYINDLILPVDLDQKKCKFI